MTNKTTLFNNDCDGYVTWDVNRYYYLFIIIMSNFVLKIILFLKYPQLFVHWTNVGCHFGFSLLGVYQLMYLPNVMTYDL
jgi:hypothetical protein